MYKKRKKGRGLVSIEDSINTSIRRLEDYQKEQRNTDYGDQKKNTNNIMINRTTTRKQKWGKKCMEISSDKQMKSHTRRKGNLKRETESLLIVAQNNAIRTNHVNTKICKTQ